jgi:hypothetical protein
MTDEIGSDELLKQKGSMEQAVRPMVVDDVDRQVEQEKVDRMVAAGVKEPGEQHSERPPAEEA